MICLFFFLLFLIFSMLFFICSIYFMIYELVIILEFNILTLSSCSMVMSVLLDWMSFLFMSFVLFISSMVIFYSMEYMHGDLNINRFILLVVMFVLSMMLLIISPNLISILLGWDGLGLVSYCLVIYYQNVKSFNAGMLTVLTNRIGDVALLMSIVWLMNFGSFNYVNYLDLYKNSFIMQLISWMVVLAAFTKSAQIPFSSWLPAAMAAPTPVSSLVHSSTLVTAGVYLLIRFNFCFSEELKYLMLFIGCFTMFMSGLGANFEFDLKKIIALSTLSQLGLMMSILAIGDYKLSFFHLLTHALFKALLFMCAGCVIHNYSNCQDIRYMGSVSEFMPITCSFLNISNLSLCGLPFLSGFYSKDLIVEFMSMQNLNFLIYFVFYISIGLTVCYSMRLSYYLMLGTYNNIVLSGLNDKGLIMLKGMSGLILLVIFMGSLLGWLVFPIPYFICLPFIMKMMALIFIFLGGWIGFEVSKFSLNYNLKMKNFYFMSMFLGNMWNMPVLSTLFLNFTPLNLGQSYLNIDQSWVEFYGGKSLKKQLPLMSNFMQIIFKNHLKIYFLMMVFWLLMLMIIYYI
uniref:NADH-ubiquinone oxidoreductase chain 5 n=1 Tax=Cryptolestes pusillus TaxID=1173686 RepID=A0A0U2IL30_9CUCU|nr:NADH dehydrogenase subunit 5 [Cryptolestes pusillus]ALI87010.1 NADH dehydrogenase subunit 5 [Cryptolestes pusillus]